MNYGTLKNGRNIQNSIKFSKKFVHIPVLLQQVIENLKIKKEGKYIDATAGLGGHIKEILKTGCKVLAIEIDKQQFENLKKYASSFSNNQNLTLINRNYTEIKDICKKNAFYPVDGILFDLGISFDQLDKSKKGFSFKNKNDFLDMRMSESYEICAADIVNSLNENELYEIFARNSEEINSRTIAENIVKSRNMKKIQTVGNLVEIIDRSVNHHDEYVLSRIFQALRIHVNHELLNLKKALYSSLEILKNNGRLLIISFHSIEDRVVKNFIKNNIGKVSQIALIKSYSPRKFERSAKLRVIEKNIL